MAVTALAFSSGGRWLASGDGKGQARLWDLRAPQTEPQSLTNQEGKVTALAFSPGNRFLATAGEKGAVYLREISETGVARADAPAEPTPRGSPVTALAFSPDGRLAMAGQDDRVIVWRAGERETSVESAQKKTLALAFSPDGEWLASRADDGTAQLWSFDGEQPSRKPVELPASGAGAWRTLTFTTDGTGLITADENGEIRRWELRVDELIETACTAAGRNLTRREWETYIPTEPYRGGQPCPVAIRR
jgi:WD40 repeat protein